MISRFFHGRWKIPVDNNMWESVEKKAAARRGRWQALSRSAAVRGCSFVNLLRAAHRFGRRVHSFTPSRQARLSVS